MLISLQVDNYAIVEHLELDFSDGMTTFTGETGAGKSIMIDALSLALGGRADSSVVRNGSKRCTITALFQIDKQSVPALWLAEQGIDCPDNQIVLTRTIGVEGRSKASINGQLVPLQQVRELSGLLVDIHGQHQHQSLLNHQTHRLQLDNFASLQTEVSNVHELYRSYQAVGKEIEQLKANQFNEDKLELLRYQVEELNKLALSDGELDLLNNEHQRLHHAQHYLTNSNQIIELLDLCEQGNIQQQLSQVIQLLDELPSDETTIASTKDMLNTALINCQEAVNEVKQFESSVSLDPARLHLVEARLEAIYDMARKHHVEPRTLSQHYQKLKQELVNLTQANTKIEVLEQQLIITKENYLKACQHLSKARHQHGKKLAKQVTASIQQMGMPKGRVDIQITPLDKMHSHGMDKVEYLVCTNPGQSVDSLSKVASGGELSRISLAIQVITAQKASTPTLLFDEVDVGIGGATAAMVGQLLRELSQRLQVFCVTHQAQVASCAHTHFLVEKHNKGNATFSNIKALSNAERIDEVARMLGGLTITDSTRTHAEELLNCSI